ncbi:MAG TPA: DUF4238 domain-containing protein [Alphaproteobacteria bacterium]|nr:DUF4238 domain-containing protein [Alphaproteobacteria bacterium]HNS43621.1 DUF4238 domain-containing protein [Alphaproteobacteria bacterium]
MTVGDNHHFFPERFLKNFFGKKNGIRFYDKDTKKISAERNVNSIAKKKYLYSVSYGDRKDNSLESEFQKIEDRFFPILEKITEGTRPVYENEVFALVEFSIFLSLRTPTIVEMANNAMKEERIYKNVITSILDEGIPVGLAEEFGKLLLSCEGMSYLHVLPYMLEQRIKLSSENYKVVMLTCFGVHPKFVLGDTYMICNFLEPHKQPSEMYNLFMEKVEIIFPISENVCVLLSPKKAEESNKLIPNKSLTIEEILRLNSIIAGQSEKYIYSGNKLELMRISSLL